MTTTQQQTEKTEKKQPEIQTLGELKMQLAQLERMHNAGRAEEARILRDVLEVSKEVSESLDEMKSILVSQGDAIVRTVRKTDSALDDLEKEFFLLKQNGKRFFTKATDAKRNEKGEFEVTEKVVDIANVAMLAAATVTVGASAAVGYSTIKLLNTAADQLPELPSGESDNLDF